MYPKVKSIPVLISYLILAKLFCINVVVILPKKYPGVAPTRRGGIHRSMSIGRSIGPTP